MTSASCTSRRSSRTIRLEPSAAIGCSVVELAGVRHVFVSAAPRQGATLREQAWDALRAIEAVIEEEGTRGSIVMQSVFMKDLADAPACRQIMDEFYRGELPATTYIPQAPCDGKLLAIEALGVGQGPGEATIERCSPQMVVARHNGIAWVHLANICPRTPAAGVYDRSLSAFHLMNEELSARGLRFDQVVRTWLYLGDIVGAEGQFHRYMELNRARTDFYRDIRFGAGRTLPGWNKPVYPASTGIGSDGRDVIMSAIALASQRDDVMLVPLENPQQTSAFDYAHQYGPESPKFARAMVIAAGDFATTFISGTASITASETRHIDDVEAQTRQTLDNIEALVAEENFRRHGVPGLGVTLGDLALARVYVKNTEDCAKTRAVCEGRLGELPTVYVVGDVCRPELLVEIEGIAFSRRGG
jgi:enamine deaminase RidA (YjgF/YER057c/UK114 family)